MRRAVALSLLLLLAACKPSFDERYDKAEKDIRTQAAEMDGELATQPATPAPASGQPSPTPSATPKPHSR
jgi:hypothetical protein